MLKFEIDLNLGFAAVNEGMFRDTEFRWHGPDIATGIRVRDTIRELRRTNETDYGKAVELLHDAVNNELKGD